MYHAKQLNIRLQKKKKSHLMVPVAASYSDPVIKSDVYKMLGRMSKQETTDGICAARPLHFDDSCRLYAGARLDLSLHPGFAALERMGLLRAPMWPCRHKGPERCSFILINRGLPHSHPILGGSLSPRGKAHMDVFLFLSRMVFHFHNSTSLPECLNT